MYSFRYLMSSDSFRYLYTLCTASTQYFFFFLLVYCFYQNILNSKMILMDSSRPHDCWLFGMNCPFTPPFLDQWTWDQEASAVIASRLRFSFKFFTFSCLIYPPICRHTALFTCLLLLEACFCGWGRPNWLFGEIYAEQVEIQVPVSQNSWESKTSIYFNSPNLPLFKLSLASHYHFTLFEVVLTDFQFKSGYAKISAG